MIKLDNFNDNDIYLMFVTICGRYAVNNRIPLNEAALFAEQLGIMNRPVTGLTSLRNQLTIGAVDTKEHLISTIKEYCENETGATDVTDAIYQFVTELYDLCRAAMIVSHLHYNTYNNHEDVDLKRYNEKKHAK